MLLGILRMPADSIAGDYAGFMQFVSAARGAADRIEADAKVIAELRAALEAAAADKRELFALLPGPYYMDPPDGGDVLLIEQLRRMAKDAGRYRLVRRGQKWSVVNWIGETLRADQLDAAVDLALSQRQEES
ncbi:hypothetical protein UA11_04034 [Burkholderia multivorans]|nr:hypothetical protein UA11_04034 [Burkholderia multivorans]